MITTLKTFFDVSLHCPESYRKIQPVKPTNPDLKDVALLMVHAGIKNSITYYLIYHGIHALQSSTILIMYKFTQIISNKYNFNDERNVNYITSDNTNLSILKFYIPINLQYYNIKIINRLFTESLNYDNEIIILIIYNYNIYFLINDDTINL
jgi:hypothetical protein